MFNYDNKTVIVTGGNGTLGSAICLEYAKAGANLAVVIRTTPTDSDLDFVTSLGHFDGKAMLVTGDITVPTECGRIVKRIADEYDRIDVLVNNAGVQPVVSIEEMTQIEWNFVVNTNLNGTYAMSKAVLPTMKDQGFGVITHIASIEASTPALNHAHYNAAKAGVKMFARNIALEYGKYGVRANSVSPGLIDGGSLSKNWPAGFQSWNDHVPLGRCATPTDIANACLFLSSDQASFISGHDLVVDGGMGTVPAW